MFVATLVALGSLLVAAQTTVDDVVRKLINERKIQGAGIAVVKDGKVLTLKGYGFENAETKLAASENTVFEIASLTKQFTAGVMMLVEDGKIKLDDAIGNYLKTLPEKSRIVTIRKLLNQTSGIKNYTAVEPLLVPEKACKPDEIIARVANAPLEFQPGAKWAYSNTNYFLLGLLIERALGKSYAAFIRERVFEPLGMTATRVNENSLQIKNRAVGYEPSKDGFQPAAKTDASQPFAAGAILSTAADMVKWDAALSNEKLLKRLSLDEMFAAGKLADGSRTRYGMGWIVTKIGGADLIGHSGGITGFTSNITHFPNEKLTVIVLLNSVGNFAEKLALDIAGLSLPNVAQAVAERSKPAEKIADADEKTTAFLRETMEKFARGEEDVKNRFTSDAQASLFPDKAKALSGFLLKQGAIKSFELVADESLPNNGKRRTY
jgi:CubicO group peptidase (beta-lactamase class C family)